MSSMITVLGIFLKLLLRKKLSHGQNVLIGKNVKIEDLNCSIGHNTIIEKNVDNR